MRRSRTAITHRSSTRNTMKRRTTRTKGWPALERSYLTALEAHVTRSTRSDAATGAGAGERIGRRALKLGVGTLALARMHERYAAGNGRTVAAVAREEAFFAEAIAPIEEAHCGAAAARARVAALKVELGASECNHRELLEGSRLMEKRLRHLSHQLLTAQEEERLRISRDLHDAIGQTLTGINVGLATLKNEAAADSRDLDEAITRAQQLVERSMKTVHQFAWELRPTLLDDLGLVPALRSYAKTYAERTGVKVRFLADSKSYRLDEDQRTALFRVAQGALSNVERHSGAGLARLVLSALPGAVRLEVRDNGRAFDVQRMDSSKTNKHLGLLVMRERVEMVGGRFSITSSPKQGTTVRADVPLNGDAARDD
jgi:signal transduction histidine kinase